MDAADETAPARPNAADVDLLDALPYLIGDLADAPEALLRRLFEASSLTIHITDDGDHVVISVRLPGNKLPEIIGAVEAINEAPGQIVNGACVDAVRAPGGVRTCGTRTAPLTLSPPTTVTISALSVECDEGVSGRCYQKCWSWDTVTVGAAVSGPASLSLSRGGGLWICGVQRPSSSR
ncbi:MAG TPA: hypothetical protein VJT72_03415 [Pseudonocardiaceae bacterium]|nr:hypothetical protein [Pseudonocardiaceae bacterium]